MRRPFAVPQFCYRRFLDVADAVIGEIDAEIGLALGLDVDQPENVNVAEEIERLSGQNKPGYVHLEAERTDTFDDARQDDTEQGGSDSAST